jgi:hypothetical protein
MGHNAMSIASMGRVRRRAFAITFHVFCVLPQLAKGVRDLPSGEELPAVELIHALTRRDELRFIPSKRDFFLRGDTVEIPVA